MIDIENDNLVKGKILGIEEQIAGLWLNPKNNETWSFLKIEPEERIGNVLIAGTGYPTPGMMLKYEVLWANDNSIFIDLIQFSIAFRTQHQIWINDKSLRIAFINNTHQKQHQFYLDLIKA